MIYKINCKNCNKCYIGQTYRRLGKRVKEHKSYKTVVVANHRFSNNHDMNWEKVQILDREANYFKRDISEMLHIKSEPNTLNAQADKNKNVLQFKSVEKITLFKINVIKKQT